jgi:HSP20 family protein
MARNNDNDLLMGDDLAAAFLDENMGETENTDELELVDESSEIEEQTPSGEDGWETETEEFPGQLAVDVYETENELIVKARTAGISSDDLDVEVSDGVLTISGVLSGGDDENATNWHLRECYWGVFSRTVALPVQVKEDGIEASLKDGILTIVFQKDVKNTTKVTVVKHS